MLDKAERRMLVTHPRGTPRYVTESAASRH
jgi:hypothetical protein